MSPTGKGNDSPCIPHCARRGPVSCALAGVRGGITGPAQGSTARRRRICGTCKARTEGAGRSSPCPPAAVFVSGFVCLRRARGMIPLASPIAPGEVRSAVRLRAYGAASPVRRKAVQRAAGVSAEHARRAPRVQGDHLPVCRRLFIFVSGFVCLRRARGMIPLASPIAPGADRSAVPFRAYGAASPVRRKAGQRAAGVSAEHARRALRVQGDHLPARRRLFLFQVFLYLQRV
ncbi:hypothetical protein RDSD_000006 [Oleidesulfovibrio alaskensis]